MFLSPVHTGKVSGPVAPLPNHFYTALSVSGSRLPTHLSSCECLPPSECGEAFPSTGPSTSGRRQVRRVRSGLAAVLQVPHQVPPPLQKRSRAPKARQGPPWNLLSLRPPLRPARGLPTPSPSKGNPSRRRSEPSVISLFGWGLVCFLVSQPLTHPSIHLPFPQPSKHRARRTHSREHDTYDNVSFLHVPTGLYATPVYS